MAGWNYPSVPAGQPMKLWVLANVFQTLWAPLFATEQLTLSGFALGSIAVSLVACAFSLRAAPQNCAHKHSTIHHTSLLLGKHGRRAQPQGAADRARALRLPAAGCRVRAARKRNMFNHL